MIHLRMREVIKMNRNGNEILDLYYEWLCKLVESKPRKGNYCMLLDRLYAKNFLWSVPNDDNRAFEGKNLREHFCEENDIDYEFDTFPIGVSMLELLIALAYRCEEITVDSTCDRPMYDWFWKLISNAGLHRFTDETWPNSNVDYLIDEILNKIIDRTYNRNGEGGLFPLKKNNKDQRKVELWYQMNTYLVEKYYTE